MKSCAHLRYARISPQKARLIADQVRGEPVDKVLQELSFTNKKAASLVKNLLESAIANAEHNEGADIDELEVTSIQVNEGPVLKRLRARAKGRGNRILKRTSHISITVAER